MRRASNCNDVTSLLQTAIDNVVVVIQRMIVKHLYPTRDRFWYRAMTHNTKWQLQGASNCQKPITFASFNHLSCSPCWWSKCTIHHHLINHPGNGISSYEKLVYVLFRSTFICPFVIQQLNPFVLVADVVMVWHWDHWLVWVFFILKKNMELKLDRGLTMILLIWKIAARDDAWLAMGILLTNPSLPSGYKMARSFHTAGTTLNINVKHENGHINPLLLYDLEEVFLYFECCWRTW